MSGLKISNLVIDLDGNALVQGVSLAVKPGKITALVGESGSGKTILGRAIMGLLPPGMVISGGMVELGSNCLTAMDEKDLRLVRGDRIGMILQEPLTSLNPSMPIGRQCVEGLRLHRGLSEEDAVKRAIEMLRRVRIDSPEKLMGKYPHEFSGGMRQRIMLASALLLKPELIIADEPTTALDTLSQREVLELMTELCRESGSAMLLVTHDLALAARYADDLVVMRHGQVVETGSVGALIANPTTDYSRELLAAVPTAIVAGSAAYKSCNLKDGPLVLKVRDLDVTYAANQRSGSKTHRVLKAVSCEVAKGEFVGVVGASGSGKTTLAKAIAGMIRHCGGTIDLSGCAGESGDRFASTMPQMIFQDPFGSLNPRMRIGIIVAEPLRLSNVPKAAAMQRAETQLDEVGLGGLSNRYPHQLSGGQRQRVAIARALVNDPALVIADEPTSALDVTVQAQIVALLQKLQKERGFSCLFVSHDLALVGQIADRLIVMDDGNVVESGPTFEVLTRPESDVTRALIAACPTSLSKRKLYY